MLRDDVKQRLFVTVVVLTVMITYAGPVLVQSHEDSIRREVFDTCSKEDPTNTFEYCWSLRNRARFPFWEYLLVYVPASALLWIDWLLKPNLKQSAEAFPSRTMKVLLWMGVLAVVAYGSLILWHSLFQDPSDFSPEFVLKIPWVISTWLIAPLLFYHLLAPAHFVWERKKGKFALLFLCLAPVIAISIYLIRGGR